ncbi:unnamed protein product, partial [Urochloa humidicola]
SEHQQKKNCGWPLVGPAAARIWGQVTGARPLSPPPPLSPAADRASTSVLSPPISRCSSPSPSTRPSLAMAVTSGGGARCGAGRSCGGWRRGCGAAAAGFGSGAAASRSGMGGAAGSGNGGRQGRYILLFSKVSGGIWQRRILRRWRTSVNDRFVPISDVKSMLNTGLFEGQQVSYENKRSKLSAVTFAELNFSHVSMRGCC